MTEYTPSLCIRAFSRIWRWVSRSLRGSNLSNGDVAVNIQKAAGCEHLPCVVSSVLHNWSACAPFFVVRLTEDNWGGSLALSCDEFCLLTACSVSCRAGCSQVGSAFEPGRMLHCVMLALGRPCDHVVLVYASLGGRVGASCLHPTVTESTCAACN